MSFSSSNNFVNNTSATEVPAYANDSAIGGRNGSSTPYCPNGSSTPYCPSGSTNPSGIGSQESTNYDNVNGWDMESQVHYHYHYEMGQAPVYEPNSVNYSEYEQEDGWVHLVYHSHPHNDYWYHKDWLKESYWLEKKESVEEEEEEVEEDDESEECSFESIKTPQECLDEKFVKADIQDIKGTSCSSTTSYNETDDSWNTTPSIGEEVKCEITGKKGVIEDVLTTKSGKTKLRIYWYTYSLTAPDLFLAGAAHALRGNTKEDEIYYPDTNLSVLGFPYSQEEVYPSEETLVNEDELPKDESWDRISDYEPDPCNVKCSTSKTPVANSPYSPMSIDDLITDNQEELKNYLNNHIDLAILQTVEIMNGGDTYSEAYPEAYPEAYHKFVRYYTGRSMEDCVSDNPQENEKIALEALKAYYTKNLTYQPGKMVEVYYLGYWYQGFIKGWVGDQIEIEYFDNTHKTYFLDIEDIRRSIRDYPEFSVGQSIEVSWQDPVSGMINWYPARVLDNLGVSEIDPYLNVKYDNGYGDELKAEVKFNRIRCLN